MVIGVSFKRVRLLPLAKASQQKEPSTAFTFKRSLPTAARLPLPTRNLMEEADYALKAKYAEAVRFLNLANALV